MFASDVTSDPLPSALTDYSYLNAAALLPISKVFKQTTGWLSDMLSSKCYYNGLIKFQHMGFAAETVIMFK